MDEERQDSALHLPSLSISGFRGIDELTIERLGRVTLLAGKNSVGKTTVLDAVRVYAARGHTRVLDELLESRQELAIAISEDVNRRNRFLPDFVALFHGRSVSSSSCISIGPKSTSDQLQIVENSLNEEQVSRIAEHLSIYVTRGYSQAFKVVFQDVELLLPWLLPVQGSAAARTVERYSEGAYLYSWNLMMGFAWPPPIGCQSLGSGLLADEDIMRYWSAVALTDDEERAMDALRLIFGNDLERVALVRNDEPTGKEFVQRVVAKLRGQSRPVPLQSLGDGALHLAGVVLALANSRDGFLLIDEAENGIHHSVQRDLWHMVLKAAEANNVQVIATTHSFDCVRGFAQAMAECEGIEGALVRLERQDGHLRAVEYSERNLKAAAKSHIEVR